MKRILTIKGAIVLGVAAMLLAGAAIYAQQVFNVNLTGNLTLVISGDAIQVYEGDGVTPINTGGALNFGTVSVDFFGNAPEPVYGLLYVKNLANVRVEVSVTGDLRDSILPLWGSTRETLQPYPDNAFTLESTGRTGDTQSGYLGVRLLDATAGVKQTTIIFSATEVAPVARDVNGDGIPDFIVGANNAEPGSIALLDDDGSAYVYSGADGSLLYQKNGVARTDTFGHSVSIVGDVNNDGYADFIVGAPTADPGARDRAGSVFVYSGFDGALLYRKDGTAAGYSIGWSVSAAGDVNGDGTPDFIVGAPFADPGALDAAGSAYVYSGVNGALLYKKNGVAKSDLLGYSVSTAGDVNNDGYADFIVGASFADIAGVDNVGSAFVYSGVNGALLYKIAGTSTGDQFGNSVSTAGDVNGDGYDDFIVGAPFATPGNVGSAYLYSGVDGALLHQKNGTAASDEFGSSVSTAGDVNGDGTPDFIVGARAADPGAQSSAGSAYVYSGADGALLYKKDGTAADDQFGSSVSAVGDVNGDGKGEFIVGAPSFHDPFDPLSAGTGHAYVYFGVDGSVLYTKTAEDPGDLFGISVD